MLGRLSYIVIHVGRHVFHVPRGISLLQLYGCLSLQSSLLYFWFVLSTTYLLRLLQKNSFILAIGAYFWFVLNITYLLRLLQKNTFIRAIGAFASIIS